MNQFGNKVKFSFTPIGNVNKSKSSSLEGLVVNGAPRNAELQTQAWRAEDLLLALFSALFFSGFAVIGDLGDRKC
jgi:hypothetical protein